MVFMMVGLKID